jgi:radical SAM superfamily enzyme YgiQ (UPF0313 family)
MDDPDRQLDAVIIGGDMPQEVLGAEQRQRMRLSVDGQAGSLAFLREYFGNGRDAAAAAAALRTRPLPFVSLNGPYLHDYLASRGLNVELIGLLDPRRELLDAAMRRRPRAVAISTTFLPFAAQIDAIAAEVRRRAPAAVVIAGGVQVYKSYLHKRLLEAGRIAENIRSHVCKHNYLMDERRASPLDALIVSSRGEQTLAGVLEAVRDGRDWHGLENVAWQDGGAWRLNAVREEPYLEVKVDWSRHLSGREGAYVPVQAGLGCGFRCTFCDFRGLFPRVQVREAGSILAEIATIPPGPDGLRRVYFTDDNLFTSPRRAKALCQALIDGGLPLRWRGMVRLDVVDDEAADLMARSGCMEVLLGVESGDAEILRRMRKNVTPEGVLAAVARLHRRGINTKSTFIVGFPGETEASIANTVALLNAYPTDGAAAHRYTFFTFAVLPLSEVASEESRRRYGLEGYGYHWRHATMDSATAAAAMEGLCGRLKPELSPSYVLEVPELEGMRIAQIKEAFLVRNLLVRAGEGEQDALWDRLERCFVADT